ncbi:unnamed protein product [Microthlaspi erraticum]|uniref:RNase H type-1 domain-containing protein n=1 Tax=Microthlaspi erraticum TaxID=1685480 RepID=A0A6D2JGM2_9BRAS|nr:unnamed protein product [Microthlaspi erraticum]
MEKERTLVREDGSKPSPSKSSGNINSHMHYNLYFKGLIREETTGLLAGFGVAICDEDDNLLFQTKGSLHESSITALEAELTALKQGLTQAVGLGINHIFINCDYLPVFKLVMGRSAPEKVRIALLMDDVQRIRQQLRSSIAVLMTENQTKFAYNLAMETVVSEISISIPPAQKSTTCCICFDDGLEDDQMFSVLYVVINSAWSA